MGKAEALMRAGVAPGSMALDPTRVDSSSEWDVLYWSKYYCVSPVLLARAVEQVGDKPERVHRWLVKKEQVSSAHEREIPSSRMNDFTEMK